MSIQISTTFFFLRNTKYFENGITEPSTLVEYLLLRFTQESVTKVYNNSKTVLNLFTSGAQRGGGGFGDVYRCSLTLRRLPSGFDKAAAARARSGAVQLGSGVRRCLCAERRGDDRAQLFLPQACHTDLWVPEEAELHASWI